MADVKAMFMSALSDSNNVPQCKTSKKTDPNADWEEMEIELPESYDWREAYPDCVQPVMNIGSDKNCSASFVMSALGAVEDRICMGN